MKSLSETWFADGYIDFELKKYTLLAYLQEVNQYFDERKLYPQLSDIIFHYNNLVTFRENKKFLQEQFPKKLTGIQRQQLQFLYEQMMEDDDVMSQLEEIIHYAANTFENIKTELVRSRTQLPNPATYAIEVNVPLPVEETLLPVAKRSLVRYISGGAQV